MFDIKLYQTIYSAAAQLLQNNQTKFSRDFIQRFLNEHNPNNGQVGQAYSQRLFQFTVEAAQSWYRTTRLTDEQLWQIVGEYVKKAAEAYRPVDAGGFGYSAPSGAMMQPAAAFGGTMQSSGFSYMSGGAPEPAFGGGFASMTQPQPTPQPAMQQPQQPVPVNPTKPEDQSLIYTVNPLDDLKNVNIEFVPVSTKPIFGYGRDLSSLDHGDGQKDHRIVLTHRNELKVKDRPFTISQFNGFHQIIQNNPMDVVRDFFDVIPDSLLSTFFMFQMTYNHLDVIDVPTKTFVEIRDRCIHVVRRNNHQPIHKQIREALGTAPHQHWRELTTYLTKHVNRALYLNGRMTEKLSSHLSISTFDDLDDLLSSSFTHPLVTLPEGRYALEKIVSSAIWNALVTNTAPMFSDIAMLDDLDKIPALPSSISIPTNAMQSSNAFPFRMEGVYPSKYTIPVSSEGHLLEFCIKLQKNKLAKSTFLLSRRSVVITNILGGSILPLIGQKPQAIDNAFANQLKRYDPVYSRFDVDDDDIAASDVKPYMNENYPTDQWDAYTENREDYLEQERYRFSHSRPAEFPVDQALFLIQYGQKPENYMTSIDVFSSIDQPKGYPVIMAKRPMDMIKLTD